MKKSVLLALSVLSLIILAGCGGGPKAPTLAEMIKRSYSVEKGMTKEDVANLLGGEPTNMQRVNADEIWKYEGNQIAEDKSATYHNLTIKFHDGKVSNVGTFSCKVPVKVED